MIKFLILTALVLYLVYKVGSLFFRAGAATQQFRNQQQKRSFEGNDRDQKNRKGNSKPGEYIDFEEIK
jgi:hypothetical protein